MLLGWQKDEGVWRARGSDGRRRRGVTRIREKTLIELAVCRGHLRQELGGSGVSGGVLRKERLAVATPLCYLGRGFPLLEFWSSSLPVFQSSHPFFLWQLRGGLATYQSVCSLHHHLTRCLPTRPRALTPLFCRMFVLTLISDPTAPRTHAPFVVSVALWLGLHFILVCLISSALITSLCADDCL